MGLDEQNPYDILFMTHTTRIYNNPRIKKAHRYNLDDENGWYIPTGIPLTRRSWICMGRCPSCRNPKLEPRHIRKQLKEQMRFLLPDEIDVFVSEVKSCQ